MITSNVADLEQLELRLQWQEVEVFKAKKIKPRSVGRRLIQLIDIWFNYKYINQ